MKNYNIAGHSDTGRVRSVNEDAMAAFDSPNGQVVVVCDGMGGQNAGDVASQMAVAVIRDILTDNTFSSPEEAITRSVMAANQAILNRAASNPNLSGMGATCIILIIKDGLVYYGSVGDSRIYYISDGSIMQLTRDQSYVQSLVDSGEISPEEAEHHQDKNQITNALGIETMTPPVLSPTPVAPAPGSVFLLCSDGLSNMLSPEAILNIVARDNIPVQQRAEALIEQANNAGGTDNITVQLVEFPSIPKSTAYASVSNNGMKNEIKKNRQLTYILAALTLIVLLGGGIAWYFTDVKPDDSKNIPAPSAPTSTTVTPATPRHESAKIVKKVIIEEEIVETPAKNRKNVEKKQKKPADKVTPPSADAFKPKSDSKDSKYPQDAKESQDTKEPKEPDGTLRKFEGNK